MIYFLFKKKTHLFNSLGTNRKCAQEPRVGELYTCHRTEAKMTSYTTMTNAGSPLVPMPAARPPRSGRALPPLCAAESPDRWLPCPPSSSPLLLGFLEVTESFCHRQSYQGCCWPVTATWCLGLAKSWPPQGPELRPPKPPPLLDPKFED